MTPSATAAILTKLRNMLRRAPVRPSRMTQGWGKINGEQLEDRVLLSITDTSGVLMVETAFAPSVVAPLLLSESTPVPLELGALSSEPSVLDTSFDITKFSASVANMQPSQQQPIGTLLAFSTDPRTDGTSTTTFGPNASVLIGYASAGNGTFQPLLLARGTVQLSYGGGFDNQITWTDGLYSLVNEDGGAVSGGMQVAQGAGSFYAADLTATGGPFQVTNIQNGVVTLASAVGTDFQIGQAVQFSQLSNDATGIENATTYYIINFSESDPTQFTISDLPNGSALSANASTAMVEPDTTSPVSVVGIAAGVVTTSSPHGYLYGDQVVFSSLQGVVDRDSLDPLQNGKTYYVVNPANGTITDTTFGISSTPPQFGVADALVNSDATSGLSTSSDLPLAVTSVGDGLVTTSGPHGFAAGQAIQFSNLQGAVGLSNGKTYYVVNDNSLPSNQFKVTDTQGGSTLSGASATSGYVDADLDAPIEITSVVDGLVQTQYAHGLVNGQAVSFANIGDDTNISTQATYYVTGIVEADPTQFYISQTPDGQVYEIANAVGGTLRASFPATPQAKGAIITQQSAVAMPIATPKHPMSSTLKPDQANLQFLPQRLLLAAPGQGPNNTQGPVLLFSGVQAVGYKSINASVSIGGQDAGAGKYLELDTSGRVTFIDSGTGARNIVLTASLGSVPGTNPRAFDFMKGSSVFSSTNPLLQEGDYIVFSSLKNPTNVTINRPYRISLVASNPLEFYINDPTVNNASTFSADGGTYNYAVQLSIQDGLVTTNVPHKFQPGQVIYLDRLSADATLPSGTYYVHSVPSATTFTISESLADDPLTSGNASSAVTYVPLSQLGGFSIGGSVSIEFDFADENTGTPATLTLSGFVTASYDNGEGFSINGTAMLGAADNSAPGLIIQWEDGNTGESTVESFAAALNVSVTSKSSGASDANTIWTASTSGLTLERSYDTDGVTELYGVFGTISASFPSWNNATFNLNLGFGKSDGFVIAVAQDGSKSLRFLDVGLQFDSLSPTQGQSVVNTTSTPAQLRVYGAEIILVHTTSNGNSYWTVGGQATLAVGDATPDDNGGWKTQPSLITIEVTPGVMVWDDSGFHFQIQQGARLEVDITGSFNVKVLNFRANGVTFILDWTGADLMILLSGQVILTSLKNTSLTLGGGNGGSGLSIDTDTGAWHLDGWRITFPTLNLTSIKLENVTIGFTGGGSSTNPANVENWDLDVSGILRLMKYGSSSGMPIYVKLDFGEVNGQFVVHSLGASVTGLNPGIPIGDTGGFATDIGAEADNLVTANWSGSFLIGGNFGDQISIGGKEYALIHVDINGDFDRHHFELLGALQFVGGILGTANVDLDFDWGINTYTFDIQGTFLDQILDAEAELQVIAKQSITGYFKGDLRVPPQIPIIGGKKLAEAEVYFDHALNDDTDSFIAAWGTFFDKWTDGIRHDYRTGRTTHIGGKDVAGITASIPDSLKNKENPANTVSMSADTTAPSSSDPSAALLTDDASIYSRGTFHVVWDASDTSAKIYVTSPAGTSVQVWGDGADLTADPDLEYALSSTSVSGDILVQVLPVNQADPYTDLLDNGTFTVTLATEDTPPVDLSSQWDFSYTAPPPQVQGLSITQPKGNALGEVDDSTDRNTIPVAFQYRTTDLSSTSVDLYYDYTGTGFNGVKFASLGSSDLTPPAADAAVGDWTTHTYNWDISDLPVFPMYVYAVIHDTQHAPQMAGYAANQTNPNELQAVIPHPPINVSVNINPNGGTAEELQDWLVTVTPVLQSNISSITNGVVTTSDVFPLAVGQPIVFSGLINPDNVVNDKTYYVAAINSSTNTFTFAEEIGAPAVGNASATIGDNSSVFADDPTATPVSKLTWTSGTVTINAEKPSYYRVEVTPKSVGYVPSNDQTVSANGDAVTYIEVTSNTNEINPGFNFDRIAVIQGRVYADADGDGALDGTDPGASSIELFVDDNKNGILDPGELAVETSSDGSFTFYPLNPASNYAPNLVVQLPYGWIAPGSSPTTLPVTFDQGQSFGNDFLIQQQVILGGVVYNDVNGNGVKDNGELGLPNVTVVLTGPDSATVLTGSDGSWRYVTNARGAYTAQVVANGAAITAPFQASPQVGGQSDASFGLNTPLTEDNDYAPYAQLMGLAADYDAAGNPTYYAGFHWLYAASYTDSGMATISQFNSDGTNARTLYAHDLQETHLGNKVIAGSSPGIPGLVFATVYGTDDNDVDTSQSILHIEPDGTTSESSVNLGSVIAAWPHLGSSGGLAMVDSTGAVYTLSRDGNYAPTRIGAIVGTPADVVAIPTPGAAAGAPESLAVLATYNGQVVVYIVTPGATSADPATISKPILIDGQVGWSIAAGDYNADGVTDLAVLSTVGQPPVGGDVQYSVTFLISDGKGDFSDVSAIDQGTFISQQHPFQNPYLTTVDVLGNGGQQLAYGVFNPDGVNGRMYIASVTGDTGTSLNVSRQSISETVSGSETFASIHFATAATANLAQQKPGQLLRLNAAFNNPASSSSGMITAATVDIQRQIDSQFEIPAAWTQAGGEIGGLNFGLYNAPTNLSSYLSTRAFTGDADSGISTSKTYTHAVNAGGPALTINGVNFADGVNIDGPNYTIRGLNNDGSTDAPEGFTGFQNHLTGSINALATDFYYSGVVPNMLVTLSGLTPGQTYTTTFYGAGFGNPGGRVITASDSSRGMELTFDENEFGDGNGILLTNTFTAQSDSITYYLEGQAGVTFHLYGFSNEVADSYVTGFTGDADSGISFIKEYTHALSFNGNGSVVNGVQFQGAMQVGANYSLAAFDGTNTSPMNGVVEYTTNVGGNSHELLENFYYSSTGDEKLTLNGLTAGATYTITFYAAGYGAGSRIQTITDGLGGSFTFDENAPGPANGLLIRHTYTATTSSVTFTIHAEDPGNSFHQYALTNEFVSGPVATPIPPPVSPPQTTPVYTTRTFTGDGDSGIANDKTYTHVVNFGGPSYGGVSGGVTFGNGTPFITSNYTITAFNPVDGTSVNPSGISGFDNNLTGGIEGVLSDFYYGSQTAFSSLLVAVRGLIPGATYTTTFYAAGYGDPGERFVNISDSQGGSLVGWDENQAGNGNGVLLQATFTATSDQIIFYFEPSLPTNPFHLYGMTNELIAAAPSAASSNTFTGVVFSDMNSNGIQDPGEPGLGNYAVQIERASGITTVMTSDGSDGHAPGTYTVNVEPGDVYIRTIAPSGAILPSTSFFGLLALPVSDTLAVTPSSSSAATLVADLQGVGVQNLAVLSGTTVQIRLIKTSDGTIYYQSYDTGLPAASGKPDFSAVDMNGDGKLDLVVGGKGGVSILYGTGLGGFQEARTYLTTELAGQDVAVGAASGGAGNSGILFAAARGGSTIYALAWDQATATLAVSPATITAPATVQELGTGDVDADGSFDLVVYDGANIYVLTGEEYGTTNNVAPLGGGGEGELVVASLRNGGAATILLARRTGSEGTLYAVQSDTSGDFSTQAIDLGSVGTTAPLWISFGDFAADNNGQLDVAVGGGSLLKLFTNTGPVAAPLEVVDTATQNDLAVDTIGVTPFVFYTGAPADLLAVDAAGNLVGYHNLVHSQSIPDTIGRPAGIDIAVHLPGTGLGAITGNIWNDLDNSGVWSGDDANWTSGGVTAYIDLNNNGVLDAGEPSEKPTPAGAFQFNYLQPGTYAVRLRLDASGISQSWPVSNNTPGAVTAVIPNAPSGKAFIDFGVATNLTSSDFDGDGNNDLLLTDPADGSVYIQFHSGLNRLGTRKVATLPSADWSVAGVADFNADGTPDILIQNKTTGALRIWQMRIGDSSAQINREYDLNYQLPAGFEVVSISDETGDNRPDLIIRNEKAREHMVVLLSPDGSAVEKLLAVPSGQSVLAVGDLNGDGHADLLLRKNSNNHLIVQLRDARQTLTSQVDLGAAPAGWVVAGIVDLLSESDPSEILFYDPTTLKTYVWELTASATRAAVHDVEIGDHNGLRVHVAEAFGPRVAITPVDPADRTTPVSSITITFSEPIEGFDLSDLKLTRNDGANLLHKSSATLVSQDGGRTWILGNLANLTTTSGSYQLLLNATGSKIHNGAGKALLNGAATSFTVTEPLTINASQNPVTGKRIQLAVEGGGITSATRFTWTVTDKPASAADPKFNVNGKRAAQSVNVTFSEAGTYTFEVTVRTGSVIKTARYTVIVNQTLNSIVIAPTSVAVAKSGTVQFMVSARDQFGHTLDQQPSFNWSLKSGRDGEIDQAGLYIAPDHRGSAKVHVTARGKSTVARVTITEKPKFHSQTAQAPAVAAYVVAADNPGGTTAKSASLIPPIHGKQAEA